MYVIIIIVSLIIIGIASASKTDKRHRDHLEKTQEVLNTIDSFSPTESYLSPISESSLSYDDTNEKICIIDRKHTPYVYNYTDIINCDLLVNGEVIAKQSGAQNTGLLSFNSKGKKNTIFIRVNINDLNCPIHNIIFLNSESSTNSTEYNSAFTIAERWQGVLTTLIYRRAQ